MNSSSKIPVMIDAYNLDLEHGTGVATYARNLSYCLRDLGYQVDILHGRRIAGTADPLLREMTFFDNGGTSSIWRDRLNRFRELVSTPTGRTGSAKAVELKGAVIAPDLLRRMAYHDRLWNVPDLFGRIQRQFTMTKQLQRVKMLNPPALMHWTYPLPIKMDRALNVYTLHDLVPMRLPYTTLDRKRRYLKLMRRIVSTADHIVTVSERSRSDIIKLLDIAPERVTNTSQSVTLPPALLSKPLDVCEREIESIYRLPPRGYYVFVGAIEPKKNVGRLIEAYLASGSRLPLLLAGPRAWKADEQLRMYLSDELKLRHRIRLLDYVPQNVLVGLIRCARALLFPSIYEGFGLPVLEAMLLGTPVLSSNTGSIPELAGDAALLVDPYDVRALSDGIHRLDTDSAFCAELAIRGTQRAKLYSPDRYAERVGNLYGQLLRGVG